MILTRSTHMVCSRCSNRDVTLTQGHTVAASTKALSLVSFLQRPTIAVIEALLLLVPSFMNASRYDDARAVFSSAVKAAESLKR